MSSHSLPAVQETLKSLFNPGDVVELRALHTARSGSVSGYFNDMDKLANAAIQLSGHVPGVYITINPVLPDLLARSNNQTKEWVKHTTSDKEVLKRPRKRGGQHGESIAGGHTFLGAADIALELQYEGREDTRRRILRGWARLIRIQKLLNELTPDKRMITLGSPGEVCFAAVKDKACELLNGEWEDTKQICEAFPEPKPSRDLLTKASERLASDGRAERDPPMSMGKRRGKTYKW